MTVTFSIEYGTAWGESLALVLQDKKYPMEWGEGAIWHVTVDGAPRSEIFARATDEGGIVLHSTGTTVIFR